MTLAVIRSARPGHGAPVVPPTPWWPSYSSFVLPRQSSLGKVGFGRPSQPAPILGDARMGSAWTSVRCHWAIEPPARVVIGPSARSAVHSRRPADLDGDDVERIRILLDVEDPLDELAGDPRAARSQPVPVPNWRSPASPRPGMM